MTRRLAALAVGAVALALVPEDASASGRRFTYAYESGVLAPGDVELEPWTTWRAKREDFYSRFDQRLELELGLTERLQTALYLNFTALSRDVGGQRESELEFGGISSEWKYKLTDPVADALGSALYFEVTGAPSELGLEAKLILDKRAGSFLTAFNLVGEREWAFEAPGQTEVEHELLAILSGGYFLTPALFAGVELRQRNAFHDGLESAELFGGPTVSYARDRWWAALTVAPQLVAFKGATTGSLNLGSQEKVQTRLLMGFDL